MKKQYLLATMLLVSCSYLRRTFPGTSVKAEPSSKPVEPPATPVVLSSLCKVSRPPEQPHVTWAPPECPVAKFGACLSAEDLVVMTKYLRAVDDWSQSTYSKCVEGK